MNDEEMHADSVQTCICGAPDGRVFHALTSEPGRQPRTWVRDRFWCPPHVPSKITQTALHRPALEVEV